MDVFAKVKELVLARFSLEEDDISLETTFESVGADSLDIVELIMEIEEEFEIEIPDEDMKKMATVGDMVEYLKENR
ncbi:MAG: acyl carrier protein [Peptococcaceae bacterium]|nr:acyl carrier protein [Peptococcaceae bacterium]